MSVLCMICKDKLINYSPTGLTGSLNQLVDNVIIATLCGHLFHDLCLKSYNEYLSKKENETSDENGIVCPSCQTRVKEEENRRVYLFEDHAEALERARMLERQENMEIYCHQLEVHLQQLQRENDVMVNTILTPTPISPPVKSFDTIVKNDRVKWLKKDGPAQTGVVLSIFKKDGKLSAKIKLDQKIRTTHRTSRLFSSFRSDKKQEVTVPFDEIVLEKDVNGNSSSPKTPQRLGINNNAKPLKINEYGSMSSINLHSLFGSASNLYNPRHSTISLDESRGLFGIQESSSEPSPVPSMNANLDDLQTATNGVVLRRPSRPSLNRSVSYSPGLPAALPRGPPMPLSQQVLIKRHSASLANSLTSSTASLDQQRDYVMITPPWMKNHQQDHLQWRSSELRASPPENKSKHVTFADDRGSSTTQSQPVTSISSSGLSPQLHLTISNNGQQYSSNLSMPNETQASQEDTRFTPEPPPRLDLIMPATQDYSLTPGNDGTNLDSPGLDEHDFNDLLDSINTGRLEDMTDDGSCFAVTLLSLLHCSNGFDEIMLFDNNADNEFSSTVKWIIREKFVIPLRKSQFVDPDYALGLKNALMHLCSEKLDVEELLTLLFEFTYKMPPFINYTKDMCDYLHQFFIDYMDKEKTRSVMELLESSLKLQDTLMLSKVPEPALILQVPHSKDGIMHYEAVIPNLTITLDHLLEQGPVLTRTCYCDNKATLECRTCSFNFGEKAVRFCEKCRDVFEDVHRNIGHPLELAQIPALEFPSSTLGLSAIICLERNHHSVFIKDGVGTYSPWLYVHNIVEGRLQMKQLPGFGYWLESILEKKSEVDIESLPILPRKALKQCRVLLYVPVRSSDV